MRRFVAGNWKMNHGPADTVRFFQRLSIQGSDTSVVPIIFPPTISLASARAALGSGSHVALGVQSVHAERSGAFTGEVSAEMAAEAGAEYVLVGHSERRWLFHETDDDTHAKVEAAHRAGLIPILCVGERIEERRGGRLEEVIVRQLDAVLGVERIADAVLSGAPLLLAYEPVWAIGTGETATPTDASEAHGILRRHAERSLGAEAAGQVGILYGGSVTIETAGDLLGAEGVSGVLVGGASLDPESFARIVEIARNPC
jgi:triosephosphate isomerase